MAGDQSLSQPPHVAISLGMKLPPEVRILSPREGQEFEADALDIEVRTTDHGGGIDEIRLYQNGKLVSETQRGLKVVGKQMEGITRTFRVALLPGVNEFRATAFNTDRTESIPHIIQIELKAIRATADLYLVVVGLNEYKNPRYQLNFGRPDAEAFSATVVDRGRNIFKSITHYPLFDDTATRTSIESALGKVESASRESDAFVFYFAGHGVMSEGDGRTKPDFYLVPYDVTQLYGNDEQLEAKAISATQIKEWCRRIKAQKQLIVLDACQSGGAVELFAMRGAAEEKAMSQLARSAGVAVMASAGTQQFAAEFQALGHGAFTYLLLQGLEGQADGGTHDGKITVSELRAYIEDELPQLTKKQRGSVQYPNVYMSGQDFPLGVAK